MIVVKSNTSELFEVDAATGIADRIELTGGDAELVNADGMLLTGRKLYVVENRDDPDPGAAGVGVISVVKLTRNLSSGRITGTIHSDLFQVPTTIARSGGRNYCTAMAVLALLSGGSAGAARLAVVGPVPWQAALATFVEIGVPATVVAALLHRRSRPAEADVSPRSADPAAHP